MKERSKSLDKILIRFGLMKDVFSSIDAYYACRMLLIEFYDKQYTSDYLFFIFENALEHLEADDLKILKEFINSYNTNIYKSLDRRIEDVSTNQ